MKVHAMLFQSTAERLYRSARHYYIQGQFSQTEYLQKRAAEYALMAADICNRMRNQ